MWCACPTLLSLALPGEAVFISQYRMGNFPKIVLQEEALRAFRCRDRDGWMTPVYARSSLDCNALVTTRSLIRTEHMS